MASFIIATLALFTFSLSTTTQNIERAFLQNNSRLLYQLFSAQNPINVSLPEPIYFSDQLSNEQAYFVFKNIFSAYSTFEFYSERQPQSSERSHIYQARWSFRDKKNNDQYLFYIFFYLIEETSGKNRSPDILWKITEIKAKKI